MRVVRSIGEPKELTSSLPRTRVHSAKTGSSLIRKKKVSPELRRIGSSALLRLVLRRRLVLSKDYVFSEYHMIFLIARAL